MDRRKLKVLLMCGVWLLAAAGALLYGARERREEFLEQNVVRFHIRANSDSRRDQELKMKVKDALSGELSGLLAEAGTKEEAKKLLAASIPEIEECAEEALRENGSVDPVSVRLGKAPYPEKQWGGLSLPAGTYEALTVYIGEGKGHNWWCVLYPFLGFSDILKVYDGSGQEAFAEDMPSDAVRDVLLHPDRVQIGLRWLDGLFE